LRDPGKAVQVVQHHYQTKAATKYLGNKNQNCPRKNWSGLVPWNCGQPKHRMLTPEFVMQQSGAFLHRFQRLDDADVGALPTECMADEWHAAHERSQSGMHV
jgi:hypothetical protein